jgi:L-fuconolactonase
MTGSTPATGLSPEATTPIVDAHFHSWLLSRGDYRWLTPALGRIHRDVAIDDWAHEAAAHGVQAGMLVQAAPTEAETAWLLEQASSDPRVWGVVGWVDLLAGDAPRRIEALARHPKLKGLRPMLQDLPDPDWIGQAALAPALQAMAACGLVFDALITPIHLPRILRLAQAHPGLALVIDHAAKPAIAAGAWQPWADDLQRIARDTAAVCKLSGLFTECGGPPPPGRVRPWAQHVLDSFGSRRVLWGSDWPVLERAGSYASWWAETERLLAPLTAVDRAAILGGNALRVYGLSPSR